MTRYRLCVTQTYRIEKQLFVTIEADNIHEAIEIQQERGSPAFDAKTWTVKSCDLMNQDVDRA